jgi:hypothetical protein
MPPCSRGGRGEAWSSRASGSQQVFRWIKDGKAKVRLRDESIYDGLTGGQLV